MLLGTILSADYPRGRPPPEFLILFAALGNDYVGPQCTWQGKLRSKFSLTSPPPVQQGRSFKAHLFLVGGRGHYWAGISQAESCFSKCLDLNHLYG